MATIHIARLVGDEGFSRLVAAKRLLSEYAQDAEFVTMFLDEARVASKVHHRNVVPVLDVVTTDTDVILVQEYVHGIALNVLLREARRTKTHMPVRVAVSIASQVLAGLQAAHTTVDEVGIPLNIVHRDVSPHNVMISVDGTARLLDFGVAKATMAAHITRENTFKGKLAYSAPEQLSGSAVAQSDVYSTTVTLWEMLVGRRLHVNLTEREIAGKIMTGQIPSVREALADERELIAKERWREIEAIDPIVQKGLAVELHDRWPTAAAMESALNAAVAPASLAEIAAWVHANGREIVEQNEKMIAQEEASWRRRGSAGRLGAPPVERPRPSLVDVPTTVDESSFGSLRPSMSPATDRRRLWSAVALGAIGGLALVLVILLVTRHGDDASPPPPPAAELPATTPPPTPAAQPVAPPVPTPAPPVVVPAPPPPVVVPAPPPPEHVEAPPPPHAPPPTPKPRPVHVVKSPPPPPPRHPAPPTTTPAVEAPAEAAKSCNPPYYYEGKKKIFKAACL